MAIRLHRTTPTSSHPMPLLDPHQIGLPLTPPNRRTSRAHAIETSFVVHMCGGDRAAKGRYRQGGRGGASGSVERLYIYKYIHRHTMPTLGCHQMFNMYFINTIITESWLLVGVYHSIFSDRLFGCELVFLSQSRNRVPSQVSDLLMTKFGKICLLELN